MIRKIGLTLGLGVFLLFSYFQLNDPDSLMWTIYYVLLAVLAFLSLTGRNRLLFTGLLTIFTLGYMIYLFPGFRDWLVDGMPSITSSMKAESPYIEVVREFLGLGIGLIFLVILLFDHKRQHTS